MRVQFLQTVSKMLEVLAELPEEPGNLSSTLRHIAQSAKFFFEGDICTIVAINPITRRFVEPLTVVGNPITTFAYNEPRTDGMTHKVLKKGVFFIEDIDHELEYESLFARQEGIHSLAALTLYTPHRQNQLGVLYINFRNPRSFSSEERQLYQIFCDQASFLLQECWLLLHCQEVEQIGQEINQDLATIDLLFEKLKKYVANILNTSYTLLLSIYQHQSNTLDFYIQEEGRSFTEFGKTLDGACSYVIRTQKTRFIRHLSLEKDTLPFRLLPIVGTGPKESYIFVPLRLRDETLGVLSIQHPEPDAYSQEDIFVLELLANHVALALYNIQLYDNLSRLSEAGQYLTQQLDSEQILQSIVDKIYMDTQADVVILYDYDPTNQHFGHLPYIAGTLHHPSAREYMYPSRSDDIARLMVSHSTPIFARESRVVYSTLIEGSSPRGRSFIAREEIRSTAAIRLAVRDVVEGVLFVNFRQSQHFDEPQRRLIEGLASYAAISIKNSQIFSTLNQRRTREATILQNIHQSLNRDLELKAVLDTLLAQANELIEAEDASILLYNSCIQALETRATIGKGAIERNSVVIPLQDMKGITLWVWEHKKPARVDDVNQDPQWKDVYLLTDANTISELDVPLVDDGEVVGVLNFESPRKSAFNEDSTNFLLTLAGQTVLAVKKAQAYEREKHLAEEREALNQISREIVSQLNAVPVFDLILQKALKLTNSTMGALLLYDAEKNEVWMVAEHGAAEDKKHLRMSADRGIVGWVARNKKFLNVNVTQAPWSEMYVEFVKGTCSELAVPMFRESNVLGVLNIESPELNHFGERDERVLQGLADLAVVALQSADHYNKAKRDAERFALLYEVGQELGKITDIEQLVRVYDVIVQIAKKQSQGSVVIRRYESSTEELVLIHTEEAQSEDLFPRLKLHEGINGQVAREQRIIVVNDVNHPPSGIALAKLPTQAIQSLAVAPILFGDRYYGNLELNHRETNYFKDADIQFIDGLAQQLAITIYRLEEAQARQLAEKRAASTEIMGWIGQFIFELAHRRGNDLGLIKSYVNDIRAELKKRNVFSAIIDKKLEQLVQDARIVLDMNKQIKHVMTTFGEIMTAQPATIHPRELLEEAYSDAQRTLSSVTDSLIVLEEFKIAADIAHVRVTHVLVADILHNLIQNAIEAMSVHGGTLTLTAWNDGRYVALSVSDTGIGIPPAQQRKVFDFAYATKSSTGFGLWSAYRNARYNQGDLKVSSRPGQTTFTLFLPKADGGVWR